VQNRSAAEVAGRLARLHTEAFANTKKQKLLRITHDGFCRLADLQILREAKFREIAHKLLDEHHLILGRGHDFFTLFPAVSCGTWSFLSTAAVSRELKRKMPIPEVAPKTQITLTPQAAWPYPSVSKP
jgi:hypothetical protein